MSWGTNKLDTGQIFKTQLNELVENFSCKNEDSLKMIYTSLLACCGRILYRIEREEEENWSDYENDPIWQESKSDWEKGKVEYVIKQL